MEKRRVVGQKFAQQMHDNAHPKALDRELFNAACEVAHRIRRDEFYASGVSVFVKTKDFEVHSKQCSLSQPTDVTALLLNEARRMVPIVWDGVCRRRLCS